MIYLRNVKTGEQVATPAEHQDGFAAKDGWVRLPAKPEAPAFGPGDDARLTEIRGLSTEERFDILMDRIEELEARLIALENVV